MLIQSQEPQSDQSLELFNDVADNLRKLNERWKNRLILNGHQSFVEKYRDGGLTVVCDLDFASVLKRDIREVDSSVLRQHREISPLVASVVLQAHPVDNPNLYHWQQQHVFVEDVEFVKGEDGLTIPSLVRFYDIHDEISDCLRGLAYCSAFHGTYKFIPGGINRELGVLGALSSLEKHNVIAEKIQSTFQIVDGISDDKSRIVWKGLRYSELQKCLSGIRVSLNAKGVEVTLSEAVHPVVKVVDVLYGPFNL